MVQDPGPSDPRRHNKVGRGFLPVSISVLLGLVCGRNVTGAGEASAYWLPLPLGLQAQASYIPDDNPLTAAKIALGKQFFWDTRWSSSGTVACVSCHQPQHGWSDPRPFSISAAGQPTRRHAPTIINRLFSDRQLWTGLRDSLEDQARKDGNTTPDAVVHQLGAIAAYQAQCRQVFGTELHPEGVAQAIAAYVRTILSGNAPYDRFLAGDQQALSPAAQRGLALFAGKARCVTCHAGFNFTDESFHNLGVGMDRDHPDLGRYLVTQAEADRGAFKTPTLRDVARRGPYMHDGSLKALEAVVAWYNHGGHNNPWLSKELRPLNLTEHEQADLVAFLQALTGEMAADVARPPELPR